jgi:hypothetical protein
VRPDVPSVLTAIAALIESRAAAAAPGDYGAEELLRAAPLLRIAADEYDCAAAWRVEEIRAWQALFARAAEGVDDPGLAADLARAAAPHEGDDPQALRVPALDARLAALRAQAIALQAWAESSRAPAAADLGRALWAALRAGTERRRVPGARF